nr:hypothetical protein [uncultured Sphingomonas sp.]
MRYLLLAAMLVVGPPNVNPCNAAFAAAAACCKVCSKGKACGNSCIARNKTCHQPRGCACDG